MDTLTITEVALKPQEDFYRVRLRTAFDALERDHTAGAILWAAKYLPFMHRRLTRDFPRWIERAWDGPHEDFDNLLCSFVRLHLEIVEYYRRNSSFFPTRKHQRRKGEADVVRTFAES